MKERDLLGRNFLSVGFQSCCSCLKVNFKVPLIMKMLSMLLLAVSFLDRFHLLVS